MKRQTRKAKGKLKRQTKRKLFYIAIYLLGLTIWYIVLQNTIPKPKYTKSYVVQSGDTIWDIARYSDAYNDIDRRYITDEIVKTAGNNANIKVGQTVQIPMYKGN